MLKRTLSMILVLVLMLSILPATAGAVSDGLDILDGPRTYASYYESESNDSYSSADPIDPTSASVFGEVGNMADGDEDDYFVFTIGGCRRLDLYGISGTNGEQTTYFSVYRADGTLVATANYYGVDSYGDDNFELQVDLAPGTYYIRVSDDYNWVEYVFYTDLTPLLDTPVVTASNRASDGKIKLSWDPVSGAGCYYILRSDNTLFINPHLFYTYDTSYADTTAEAGTTYYYKVYASSTDPNILNSMYCAAVKRTCDLPRPAGVKITRDSSTGKNKITWNKVKGADKYSVYYSTDGGSTYSLLKTTTGTSLTHTSAPVGKTCHYKVKAVYSKDTAANSAYSSSVNGTATLAAPTVTVSNVASTGKIKLTWNAVSGAAKYTVYIYDAGGNLLKTSSTSGTSLTHTSAVAGTTYTYKVKAIGSVSAANSSYSAAKSRTCDLAAPTLSVTTTSAGKPKLTWGKVSGASKYSVYYSVDGVNFSLLKTMTGTSLTHSSAAGGKTYYYKVMAVKGSNTDANSAFSGTGKVTLPGAVPVLSITANSYGKPKLSWSAVPGATQYKVYYSIDTVTWGVLKTMTGTSLTHASAQSGTTYYYKIVAVSASGNSPFSNMLAFTAE